MVTARRRPAESCRSPTGREGLQISEQTIHMQRREDLIDSGPSAGHDHSDNAELVAVRRLQGRRRPVPPRHPAEVDGAVPGSSLQPRYGYVEDLYPGQASQPNTTHGEALQQRLELA